jgi:hypothetical protein
MKIYITTSGEYSDYHITAVFSDKEKAQEYADIFSCGSNYIEEYELDKIPNGWERGMKSWSVSIYDDPNIGAIARLADSSPINEEFSYHTANELYSWDNKGSYGWTNCWAKDEEHAIKICSERRAIYFASKVG